MLAEPLRARFQICKPSVNLRAIAESPVFMQRISWHAEGLRGVAGLRWLYATGPWYVPSAARAPAGPCPPGCGLAAGPQRALACPPARPHAGPPRASSAGTRFQPGRVSPRLGGARLRPGRGPSCPCGVAPAGARSPAPGPLRPQPWPGPGGFRRPGASPCASEERASGRAGGRAAHAGWPPRALARQPPACAALGLGPVQAASDARACLPTPRRSAPRAGLGAELPMQGGPLGRLLASPRPAPSSPGRTASPPPGSHVRSAGASMLQAVARPLVLSGCVLRLGRRSATRRPQPARFPWDGRPRGKTPPGYAAATARLGPRARLYATAPGYGRAMAGRRPGLGSVGVRSWRPGRRQRPCHRALCVLTRRGCPILYVPAQCAPAKTEALLPSQKRALHFGRDGTPGRRRAADTLAGGGPARRSPSAAGRDRRNLKLARRTGRGPAAASATPRRRPPCPIFTLLLILLTTPS